MTKLSLSVPCQIFSRLPGEDWHELDNAPGIFHLEEGVEAGIRIQNTKDAELEKLLIEVDNNPQLKMLNLSENRRITNQGLELLKLVPGLTSLNLSSCDISDKGTPFILVLKRLEWLNLSFCNRITFFGLKPLASLSHLKYLDLQGCVKIKNADVQRLDFRNTTIHK